jgi:hypothetical protein
MASADPVVFQQQPRYVTRRTRRSYCAQRFNLVNPVAIGSYKNDYRRFWVRQKNARIYLILLVGSGRFERPTPCAQGGIRKSAKSSVSKHPEFSAVVQFLLKVVASCWPSRLLSATKSTTTTLRYLPFSITF